MSEQSESRKVFAAIEAVMTDIAKLGVAKNQTNTQQNFKYRGVDDVMDALSPLLAKHHLLILPSVEAHELRERTLRSGATVLHAVLKLSYTFVCPVDSSMVIVGPIYGEAMDSGDKATNKAMSAGYKYLCTQSFCIPFSGDDPDAQSHEIAGTGAEGSDSSGAKGVHRSPPASSVQRHGTASANASSLPDASVPGEPLSRRPGGAFGYGKKHRDTPWNVMKGDDLEWFLNADRTPQDVRAKIVAELEWRDYEHARMDAVDQQARMQRQAPLDNDIP